MSSLRCPLPCHIVIGSGALSIRLPAPVSSGLDGFSSTLIWKLFGVGFLLKKNRVALPPPQSLHAMEGHVMIAFLPTILNQLFRVLTRATQEEVAVNVTR